MEKNTAVEDQTATELNPFRCQGFVRNGFIYAANGERYPMHELPAFLRALLVTDGTVTKILEAYFWEPVTVETQSQTFISAQQAIPWIDLKPNDQVLERHACLCGADTGNQYAEAYSVIRTELIPSDFRQRLIDRVIGIGALIRDSGLESYREVLKVGLVTAASDQHNSASVFRTYRIIIDQVPVILITETFPLARYALKSL